MVTLPNTYTALDARVSAFLAQEQRLLIGGRWLPAHSGETFTTYDPSSGLPLAAVPRAAAADVELAVQAARAAFDSGPWRSGLSPLERARLLWRLADLLEQHAEALAQLEALDNGKPLATARSVDVPLSVDHLRYFSGWANKIEGATIPVNEKNMFAYTVREPIGVCGLIVPWNYPLLMAIWKIAPALAAGNCVILKPAEQTPLSALYLARLFEEAGFPPGVCNVLTGYGEEAGAALVDHHGVDKIGFTGSTEVARAIVKASVSNLKRVSLELGGKSPNIVFADADLEQAIHGATWAIFGNNGQSCTAGARLYIERRVFEDVVEGIAEKTRAITLGAGLDPSPHDLGPVISAEQLARVTGYIEAGLRGGARLVTGGERLGGVLAGGYFLQPTLFIDAHDDLSIVREEIFGPVVCALPFDDPAEVLRRANSSEYGLAAGIWTHDLRKAQRFAAALQAGTVWINTWGNTEAAVPFGGYKQSGHGREMGYDAIQLYTEVKSVWTYYG
ncbi:MAG: aldehyde dehydrogenase family protein [Chloroflexi bacterium]|nr:aldehyde dehydrogenase family protein [Chloroflexota bacterium]